MAKNNETPEAPILPTAKATRPSSLQNQRGLRNLRGLRQYQQQQEYPARKSPQQLNETIDETAEDSLASFPIANHASINDTNKPTDTNIISADHLETKQVPSNEEQARLHALDSYFAHKLGIKTSPDLEHSIAKIPTIAKPTSTFQDTNSASKNENVENLSIQKDVSKDVSSQKDFAPNKSIEHNSRNKYSPQSPYRKFIAELSDNDMDYLLEQSNATVQALLLKNTSRRKRCHILRQMPRLQRTELLRSLAKNKQKLYGESSLRVFHWLRRKIEQHNGKINHIKNQEVYPEISGTKALSMILDELQPEQQERIMQNVTQNDPELGDWLQRDRGSLEQREILSQIIRELSDLELAVLFAIPQYGRLLRHLLDGNKKTDVLNASIDLAQLPQNKRQEIENKLFAQFPILQEW